ncbi:MAG: VRR-NUC domain-containing protein [Bacteroidota bacterium]
MAWSEDRLQQECVMWFNNKYPELRGTLFSVPNGGTRNAREAMKMKQTGLYPGVSDLLFMHKGVTTCFELKTSVGKQSDNQKKWQKVIEEQHFKYFLIRELDLFKEIVNSIIYNKV